MPGQVMIVTAQVKDTLGIKSAVAVFENEKMPDERSMPLITGNGRNGVYETRWIVHDTKAQGWYNTTIIFTDILGKKSVKEIAWQDPTVTHKADDITPGTFGAGDYAFPGNLNVTGNLTNKKEIILNQLTSSPSNNTGSGKIYYKQSDIDSYTKLASHFDGADGATAYTDPARSEAYTFGGTAQLDTAQYKFGTASLLLDGNSDYVYLADSPDWDWGSGDFTIDSWIRFASVAAGQAILSRAPDATEYFYLALEAGGLRFRDYKDPGGTIDVTRSWSPSVDNWYHVAVVRNGNNLRMFIDGTQIGTNADVTGLSMVERSNPLTIGFITGGFYYFNGWIDEPRISKGIARWTSNFTVPSLAYGLSGLVFMYQNGTNKLLAGE